MVLPAFFREPYWNCGSKTPFRMPTTNEFIALIQQRLAEQEVTIDADDDLLGSGLVDSIGMMRLIGDLEREMGRRIPPTALVPENFQTVRVMAQFLSKLVESDR